MTLSSALKRAGANVKYVADPKGLPAQQLAKRIGAQLATSDHRAVLEDPSVDAVIIAVGHHLHATLAIEALEAGKHVLVEKPLALTIEEVAAVKEAVGRHPDLGYMVGFNRRFSPHIKRMAEALRRRSEPLTMTYTVNAGSIPADHWVHDPETGGGRIIGEACHFIDLMVYLSGSLVQSVSAFQMGPGPAVRDDKMAIILRLRTVLSEPSITSPMGLVPIPRNHWQSSARAE